MPPGRAAPGTLGVADDPGHAADHQDRSAGRDQCSVYQLVCRKRWIELTGQQLTDVLVYLQNLPQTRYMAGKLQIVESDRGQELFQSKGAASGKGFYDWSVKGADEVRAAAPVATPAHWRSKPACGARP